MSHCEQQRAFYHHDLTAACDGCGAAHRRATGAVTHVRKLLLALSPIIFMIAFAICVMIVGVAVD